MKGYYTKQISFSVLADAIIYIATGIFLFYSPDYIQHILLPFFITAVWLKNIITTLKLNAIARDQFKEEQL